MNSATRPQPPQELLPGGHPVPRHPPAPIPAASAFRAAGAGLALTILLGAFLLFQVQPLISKFILPWFGGCPAVWTTAMLFFQMLLFGGYVYAHLLQRFFAPRGQAMVHLALVLLALALLPVVPNESWKPADSSSPTWRILALLTASVGLPYFVLSATSPLVQVWFSRRCAGRSPYRLYALSNAGSLAALLSYPFLFEPVLDLPRQAALWSWLFGLYAVFCGGCLVCLWRVRPAAPPAEGAPAPAAGEAAVTPWQRVLWLVLPACASLMLLAATNYVCQDVAVVPLLWVVPLALYLLTFIIAFDHPRWYVRGWWAAAAALAILVLVDYETLRWFTPRLGFAKELVLYFGALFLVCMVCHGELVRLRPPPRRLTEFYLLISAGGATGGVLVSIVAPLVFRTYFEWQIGLAASFVLAATALALALAPHAARRLRAAGVAAAMALALGFLVYAQYAAIPALEQSRNFFGTVTVGVRELESTGEQWLVMKHGWVTHGRQFLDPAKRRWPTYAYGTPSGVGQAFGYLNRGGGKLRVGMVGLGVGTLAAYARPGDQYRFYEINPEVLRLARKYFTFLDDCRGQWDVVLGDGRLSLEREPPQRFNLLVLDAFSGDSVPTHMLTREAFEVYQRHLAPDGVIAVHITNTYLHLAPVVRGLAENCGLKHVRIYSEGDRQRLQYHSDWMLLTRNEDFLRAIPAQPPKDAGDDFTVPLWTDHYSNLFQILRGAVP